MTADVLNTSKAVAVESMLKRCVVLVLRCGYLGNNRKVDVTTLKIETDEGHAFTDGEKRQVRMSKELVGKKELRACSHAIGSVKNLLQSRSAAQGHRVFGPGAYLVPIANLLACITDLDARITDVGVHAKALRARWADIVAARQAEMGPLFKAKDYATPEEVEAAFTVDYSFVSFAAPEQLLDVDRGLAEAAHAKHEQRMADAFDEVIFQLRAAALKVMSDLADRLTPGPDGKPKAIRSSALRDLQQFAQWLPTRNVGADGELAQAVARVAAYAEGLTPETLREAPAVRAELQRRAADAVTVLESLVATAASRGIAFGSLTAD